MPGWDNSFLIPHSSFFIPHSSFFIHPMPTVLEIHRFLSTLSPHDYPEEGILFGEPDMGVTGVLVCWMPDVEALQAAARQGCNLVVLHELSFFGIAPDGNHSRHDHWKANRLRRELLEKHGIALVRSHRTMDDYCVPEVFQEMLGLPDPSVMEQMAGHDAVRIFDIEPATVRELAERWKPVVGMDTVRAFAPDPERVVTRLGLCWGGIGLHSNMAVMARLVELEAEVLLGGETEEYTAEFCRDCAVDFIELGHLTSEQPGMLVAADVLSRRFPHLKVHRFEQTPPWRFM
jgi:putative NIF3 family GTP cyclohydrolase 1 type 2